MFEKRNVQDGVIVFDAPRRRSFVRQLRSVKDEDC